MLTQGASSFDTCTSRLAMKSTSPQILGSPDSQTAAHSAPLPTSDGSFVDSASVVTGTFLSGKEENPFVKISSHKHCNSTCVKGEEKQAVEIEICAFGTPVNQNSGIDKGALSLQKVDDSFDIACGEQQRAECETDDSRIVKIHVDVNACSSEMNKLSVNAREAQIFHEGQGEVQGELSTTNQGIESVPPHTQAASNGLNDDVSNLSNKKEIEGQSSITPQPGKPAVWRTPEPKASVVQETEFTMGASSWPTLAEARHAKPSEARLSPSHKETISISSLAQKVPLGQENSMEVPKHSNTNPPHPGSRYRISSHKKGSIPGSKHAVVPAENIPVSPMGAHVPSANMYNLDQSRTQNGIAGMNNFFPGPHQGPANGPVYPQNGEGLAAFPHNSVPSYGRGHPGWQHGRGYSDANYKRAEFLPTYNQQRIDPRHMHPPMAHFMNINAQYNYPNYPVPGDMSYMPAPIPQGYNYAAPYYAPPGPLVVQAFDLQTLLAKLRKQIEYYFSKENLVTDFYLTSKMDKEGFVPVSLIAKFPRIYTMTSNSMHILEALKNSSIVEVKNGKLRSHEWRGWSSGTSQNPGSESLESFAPLSNTREDHEREQGGGVSKEFGEGEMSTLPASSLIAGSCAAPWTGLSGAVNVPAVTSIDSR